MRRKRRARFHLPAVVQRAMIRLPEVSDYLEAKQRETVLNVALKLLDGGLSLNKAARLLDLSPTWLSTTLPLWRRDGFAALLPQRRGNCGRKPAAGHKPKPGACVLKLELMP